MADFDGRKTRILEEIASPGPDASPKGTIDAQILPLINRLNEHPDVVTTSSCSGRISVFLEASKKARPGESSPKAPDIEQQAGEGAVRANAGIGGKGDGGRWLFVSHDPVDLESTVDLPSLLLGQTSRQRAASGSAVDVSYSTRLVHIKFESMILHIQTRDLQSAHALLAVALSCGFRESGIMNLALGQGQSPMLAVRSGGLSMDSIVGLYDESSDHILMLVDDDFLRVQVKLSNLRFEENQRRIDIFQQKVEQALFLAHQKDVGWEDKEARRMRKREEGLKRQSEMRPPETSSHTGSDVYFEEVGGLTGLF